MEKVIRKLTYTIPALAMRGLLVFPNMVLHFNVGRKKSIQSINRALEGNQEIFLVLQKDIDVEDPALKDLYTVGVVAKVKQCLKKSDEYVRVIVEGLRKAKIVSNVHNPDYLEFEIKDLSMPLLKASEREEVSAMMRAVKSSFAEYSDAVPRIASEIPMMVLGEEDPARLIEKIMSNLIFEINEKQKILEASSIKKQLALVFELLCRETEIFGIEKDIYEKTKNQIDQNQREYFLREQMRIISSELGEDDAEAEETLEYFARIASIQNIDEDAREKLLREADRFSKMPPSAHEAMVLRNYLDTCLSLPWDELTKDTIHVSKVEKVLDKDHFGLKKVKERIIENIAVYKLEPNMKGQIICLVGPPGVGKTSIAKSIAKAIGRNYVRISLGGISDESDIRGHRKTYIGAMPGRIMSAMRQAKSRNPLVLLDEIDKMGADYKGDPSAAMLEVLDSEQNSAFVDHYIEVPFDLSNCMFIATANDLSMVPAPLLDRMEIIPISSYTREEKFNIAKKHLIKKQLQRHGLTSKMLSIRDTAVYSIIDHYTKEAGVRKIERTIASLCRKAAKMIVSGEQEKVIVTAKNIGDFLGVKKYKPDMLDQKDQVGVVNGLAWTSVGGEMMQIEASILDGSGKLELTGNLGKVMQESARTAVTYVRSIADRLGIPSDFYKNKDIHIHVPEGAVPKDGPSAGIALATVLASALTNTRIHRDVAMTGEISLRGRAMPIGGLKEKTMAAYRAGIKTVVIPKENESDLSEIEPIVKENIEFVTAESMDTVLKTALVSMPVKKEIEHKIYIHNEPAHSVTAQTSQVTV